MVNISCNTKLNKYLRFSLPVKSGSCHHNVTLQTKKMTVQNYMDIFLSFYKITVKIRCKVMVVFVMHHQ